jgi:hypothetical protein
VISGRVFPADEAAHDCDSRRLGAREIGAREIEAPEIDWRVIDAWMIGERV